jgi:hypothetical protein
VSRARRLLMNWMGRAEAEAGRADGRTECLMHVNVGGVELTARVLDAARVESDGSAYDRAYIGSFERTLERVMEVS